MNVLEKRRCFSHKTFLGAGENAVCTALEHKKYGKCGPGKVMRENSPFLTLNICNAAKSIMRKWKSILRNDKKPDDERFLQTLSGRFLCFATTVALVESQGRSST